jgi:hypothetical protein
MNTDRFLEPLSTQEANLAPKSVSETRSNQVQIEEVTINNTLVYGVYTIFVLTGTVFLLTMLKMTYGCKQDKIAKLFKQFSQIPCQNCRYFSKNFYLKCAVQPSIVLKAEAKDCSDYWPINGKFPSNQR